jgi:hypothetical protein
LTAIREQLKNNSTLISDLARNNYEVKMYRILVSLNGVF